MANYVSGPIVAAMGTAEGVIVKAKELIGAVFTHGEGTGKPQNLRGQAEPDTGEES